MHAPIRTPERIRSGRDVALLSITHPLCRPPGRSLRPRGCLLRSSFLHRYLCTSEGYLLESPSKTRRRTRYRLPSSRRLQHRVGTWPPSAVVLLKTWGERSFPAVDPQPGSWDLKKPFHLELEPQISRDEMALWLAMGSLQLLCNILLIFKSSQIRKCFFNIKAQPPQAVARQLAGCAE